MCVALERIQEFMDHTENMAPEETKMPKPSLSTLAVLNETRFLPQREPVLEVELSTKVFKSKKIIKDLCNELSTLGKIEISYSIGGRHGSRYISFACFLKMA